MSKEASMRKTLSFIVVVLAFVAAFAGLAVVMGEFFGGTTPIWVGAMNGVVAGLTFLVMNWFVRGEAFSLWPGSNSRIKARRQELVEQKHRKLADAQARASAASPH